MSFYLCFSKYVSVQSGLLVVCDGTTFHTHLSWIGECLVREGVVIEDLLSNVFDHGAPSGTKLSTPPSSISLNYPKKDHSMDPWIISSS